MQGRHAVLGRPCVRVGSAIKATGHVLNFCRLEEVTAQVPVRAIGLRIKCRYSEPENSGDEDEDEDEDGDEDTGFYGHFLLVDTRGAWREVV